MTITNKLDNEAGNKVGDYELDVDRNKSNQANKAYQSLYQTVNADITPQHPSQGTQARQEFIDYLKQCPPPRAQDQNRPISLQQLIGKKGVQLYRQALQEEINDPQFRKAVLFNATEMFSGKKLNNKLAYIIGGPSASGKTKATNQLIQKQLDNFGQDSPGAVELVTNIDGAKFRETSQMRNLVAQLVEYHGYPGVKDLTDYDEPFRPLKKAFQNMAQNNDNINVAIPETFAGINKPKLVNKFTKGTRDCYFAMVNNPNRDEFAQVIKSNGLERAWLSNPRGDKLVFNINKKSAAEQKAPAANAKASFYGSLIGSIAAAMRFKKQTHKQTNQLLSNVTLAQQDNQGNWHFGQPPDYDAHGNEQFVKIPKRQFDNWLKFKEKFAELTDQYQHDSEQLANMLKNTFDTEQDKATLYDQFEQANTNNKEGLKAYQQLCQLPVKQSKRDSYKSTFKLEDQDLLAAKPYTYILTDNQYNLYVALDYELDQIKAMLRKQGYSETGKLLMTCDSMHEHLLTGDEQQQLRVLKNDLEKMASQLSDKQLPGITNHLADMRNCLNNAAADIIKDKAIKATNITQSPYFNDCQTFIEPGKQYISTTHTPNPQPKQQNQPPPGQQNSHDYEFTTKDGKLTYYGSQQKHKGDSYTFAVEARQNSQFGNDKLAGSRQNKEFQNSKSAIKRLVNLRQEVQIARCEEKNYDKAINGIKLPSRANLARASEIVENFVAVNSHRGKEPKVVINEGTKTDPVFIKSMELYCKHAGIEYDNKTQYGYQAQIDFAYDAIKSNKKKLDEIDAIVQDNNEAYRDRQHQEAKTAAQVKPS